VSLPEAEGITGIDWTKPWLAGLAGALVTPGAGAGSDIATRLNASRPAPVRFVPQSALPAGQAYEQFIFDTGTVPTRDNLHDLFNGLCWMQFPLTKTRLNQLQAEQLAVAGVQRLRGPVRDALTVFDENAAFLQAPPLLWEALLARDWQRLFIELRPLWAQARLTLFGHALLEKLVTPRKPITAHVYIAPVAMDFNLGVDQLDAWVAASLSAAVLQGKPFAPLPVLGVPGWWPENENFSFYDDPKVFRPRS
jgi:hypothetical protein